MSFVKLDGTECKIKLKPTQRNSASAPHKRARQLLKELYPFDTAFEEVALPVKRGTTLFADFLIPNRRMMVEVHGRQHFEYVAHFHGDMHSYYKAQARDRCKAEWCELNDIELIVLKEGESIDEWRCQISKG